MFRVLLLVFVVGACAPPPPPPRPAPCPVVVEPEPCDAITPEQRQVLEELAQILNTPLVEQSAAVRLLLEQRASAVAETERLRRELDGCTHSNSELQARIEQLQSDLDELKRLTIEMEMKAK